MANQICPLCGNALTHCYSSAHGIPETYMAGSERYVCKSCDHNFYREEGESFGLKFVMDG